MSHLLTKGGHLVLKGGHLVLTSDPTNCSCCGTTQVTLTPCSGSSTTTPIYTDSTHFDISALSDNLATLIANSAVVKLSEQSSYECYVVSQGGTGSTIATATAEYSDCTDSNCYRPYNSCYPAPSAGRGNGGVGSLAYGAYLDTRTNQPIGSSSTDPSLYIWDGSNWNKLNDTYTLSFSLDFSCYSGAGCGTDHVTVTITRGDYTVDEPAFFAKSWTGDAYLTPDSTPALKVYIVIINNVCGWAVESVSLSTSGGSCPAGTVYIAQRLSTFQVSPIASYPTTSCDTTNEPGITSCEVS